MEITVKVTISKEKAPEVEFEGLWSKRDVDIAYREMRRGLLFHNKKLKEEEAKWQKKTQTQHQTLIPPVTSQQR